MRGLFELCVFLVACYVGIRIYNKRDFKLMRQNVWRHPVQELKSFTWYCMKIFALVYLMYFVLGWN